MTHYVSSMCLMIATNPNNVLKESHRVLKKDGIAAFTVWGNPEQSTYFRATEQVFAETEKV